MKLSSLRAISPVDGRYSDKVNSLRDVFSEYGLIRYRVMVEVRWLQWLADQPQITELPALTPVMKDVLNGIVDNFCTEDAEHVKRIEATTNHDVKAVEYFIRDRLGDGKDAAALHDFIHFGCTSEDINNLAYALMLRQARDEIVAPMMKRLHVTLRALASANAGVAMLSRTHGQTASPTTVGKEFANVLARLSRAREQWSAVEIRGKFNGAVGNYNAHTVAYPDIDWPALCEGFVASLGLDPNPLTTQIEPHDWTAEYAHALVRYNTVLLDFCRDTWSYISLGYFKQRVAGNEVGSSTMPHKVNPIDFENAEGNLGLSTALLNHFAVKLPVSRWQRDLTDSTVQRNFGIAVAWLTIALQSVEKGLGKLQTDPQRIGADIDASWEVLGEAVQTVMRRYGIENPYEKLKELTRGQAVTQEILAAFVRELDIPEEARQQLLALTPASYIGLAESLSSQAR